MGELTDLVFTLLGKFGRVLNVRGKRLCFLIWAVCLIYWMIRNFDLGLFVQTGGCIVSLGLHLYGWWNWKEKKIGQ